MLVHMEFQIKINKMAGKFKSKKRVKKSKSKPYQERGQKFQKTWGESNKKSGTHVKVYSSKRNEEDDLEDGNSEPVNPVDQLLGTFFKNPSNRPIVSDSDESDEEDDQEADPKKEVLGDVESEKQGNLSSSESINEQDDALSDNEAEKCGEDGFDNHLYGNLNSTILASLQSTPKLVTTSKLSWPTIGDMEVMLPVNEEQTAQPKTLLESQEFVKPASVPKKLDHINWAQLHIKPQIAKFIRQSNSENVKDLKEDLTSLQKELLSVINNYQDLFYPARSWNNCEELRYIYCLHAVNHSLKTRMKVIHHNEKLNKKQYSEVPDEFRDQGLVRPKILILVPFRHACFRIVNTISSILFGDEKGNVINKARFDDDFTGGELFMPKKNPKPEDFEHLFAGNVDDNFRIGLNLTKKSLKLYTDFYSSDIVIASPLGLRMLIGAEGDHDRDYDFLASIELLILDQADVFLMQNWEHLLHVIQYLHMQPRDSHGTDFSRVRLWSLNGWSRFYRQTIILSSIVTPELTALFNRHCCNHAGSVKVLPSASTGSISQVIVPLPHVFRRFECTSVIDAADERFNTLINDVLPQLTDVSGLLLYVPHYFDFIRLRNHLKSKDFNFVQICEYSKDGKVSRARDMFFHGEARLLLYSERFHFYRRIKLKGIRHVIFYQPPVYPHFYSEVCNMMQECNQSKEEGQDGASFSVTVMFSKYDIHSLAGIIRPARAARIISSDKKVYMFTTGAV